MAITASASSTGPRYAPPDPALPKPWRGLVDGKTGYLYFWNPETNVTQYERPIATPLPESSSLSSAKPATTTSSIQSLQSSASSALRQAQHDSKGKDGQYFGRKSPVALDCQDTPGGSGKARHDGGDMYNHGSDKESFVSSARFCGSAGVQGGLSAESYRCQHEVTVQSVVKRKFIPHDGGAIFALGGANVVRCAAVVLPSLQVHQAGFSAPTPIQAQSWPIALRNRDIVAIAKTGSGKTLGYLIPGFIHLKRCCNKSQMGPTVLILSPTRELATQIQEEAVKFGRSSGISSTCLYGGASKGPQLRDLERGMDIVVATPGRLNDILQMGRVNLQQVSYLVLDEADRMLDMGFEPQIRKIVKEIPTRRQTLMYTATWPKEVRKIASDLLANPVQVNIGNVDELAANKSITQYVEVITSMEKQRRLEQILRSQQPGSKIIIFCSTKRMCDQLSRTLNHQFGAAAIHGDKSQEERDRVLSQFRAGRSPVLVATDVAARGLDVKDIRVVINYDFPTGVEDYVHRIGRTGRAGATGVAFTFFTDQDAKHASDLIKVLEGADQQVPPGIRNMASRSGSGMGRSRRWDSSPGGRDAGQSYGGGHNGSGYGGGCGQEGGSGQNDWQHQDRYASSDGHQGTHGGNDSSRGRSRSPAKSGWGDRGQHRSCSPGFDGNKGNSSAEPVRSPSRQWQ